MQSSLLVLLEITNGEYAFIGLIGLLIWCIIIYQIIASATNQAAHKRHERIQIMLLARIAEKLGVPEEDITTALRG